MNDDAIEPASESDVPPSEPSGRWLPTGKTLGEELRQPRYLLVLAFALILILLQLWVLF